MLSETIKRKPAALCFMMLFFFPRQWTSVVTNN